MILLCVEPYDRNFLQTTQRRSGPVIKALVENGIEVVAVHNHRTHEQPIIFFLNFWGVGNAEQLAKGLRAALDQTGKKTNGAAREMGGH